MPRISLCRYPLKRSVIEIACLDVPQEDSHAKLGISQVWLYRDQGIAPPKALLRRFDCGNSNRYSKRNQSRLGFCFANWGKVPTLRLVMQAKGSSRIARTGVVDKGDGGGRERTGERQKFPVEQIRRTLQLKEA